MGLGLLAPLFLGGIALLALPWLIHRIHRPERRSMRFSSLLFVPTQQRSTVQRRAVQHLPLMLLRMLLLLLLVAAFTRPYRPLEHTPTATAAPSSGYHVIALDAALSMATTDYISQAQALASAILDSLPAADRVAILTFDATAELGSFVPPNDALARHAVRTLEPTWQATDYLHALQSAEQALLAVNAPDITRSIHLISDFQASAMPPPTTPWRLASAIVLNPIPIRPSPKANLAVHALDIRALSSDQLQIQVQLKNWSTTHIPALAVRLVLADTLAAERSINLPPGNTTRASFLLPFTGQPVHGYIEIPNDALAGDNRRYLAWNTRQQHSIVVLDQDKTTQLIQAAIPPNADLPWQLSTLPMDRLDQHLTAAGAPPRLLIAASLNGLSTAAENLVQTYLLGGGNLLLLLNKDAQPGPLNRLLKPVGIQALGPITANPPTHLAWVDLRHRIFAPFQGERYNNFDDLVFYTYHRLDYAPPTTALAFFHTPSADAPPAILESPFGQGRIIIWTAGTDLDASSLAKSPRFIPLLHETLHYLAGDRPALPAYTVGDPIIRPMQATTPPWNATLPSNTSLTLGPQTQQRFQAPGLVRWHPSQTPAAIRYAAININVAESDPASLSPAEFSIRLADRFTPMPISTPANYSPSNTLAQGSAPWHEYGHTVLYCFCIFLLFESAYVFFLAPKRAEGTAP